MNEVTINGTPLSALGATLLSGAYASLLTPPQLKEFVENDDPLKDGTDVIIPAADDTGAEDPSATLSAPAAPRVKERDVTLTFLLRGSSQADFLDRYAAFVALLHKGAVVLGVPALGRSFHLLYSSCTQFDNYRLHACQLAVKFREPNPARRTPLPATPSDPSSPSDNDNADFTTDELGIRWYKTLLTGGEQSLKVSQPLDIYPERASFTRTIDGQTICYYSRAVAAEILVEINALHGGVGDPIVLMIYSGLSSLEPIDIRTVWQPVVTDEGQWVRGDVIAAYPQMGYYKNGIWQPYETVATLDSPTGPVTIVELKPTDDGDRLDYVVDDDNVAIPLKLAVPAEPEV